MIEVGDLSNSQVIRIIKLDILSDNDTEYESEYTKFYKFILDKINVLKRYKGNDGYGGCDTEIELNDYIFYGNSTDSICIDVHIRGSNIQLCKSKFLNHILNRYENIPEDTIEYIIKYIIETKEGVTLNYLTHVNNLPPIKKL